jgi:hypothetical protein
MKTQYTSYAATFLLLFFLNGNTELFGQPQVVPETQIVLSSAEATATLKQSANGGISTNAVFQKEGLL